VVKIRSWRGETAVCWSRVGEDDKLSASCHVKARRCSCDSINRPRRSFGDEGREESFMSRLGRRRAVGDKRMPILGGQNA
jgi:hypothetical protein